MALLHIYAKVSPPEWTQFVLSELDQRLATEIKADVSLAAGGINIVVAVDSAESSQRAVDVVHDTAQAILVDFNDRPMQTNLTRLRIAIRL